MRRAVYMCCYGNVALTKLAVESALAQDVEGGVDLFIINNGSLDGTREYLDTIAGPHVFVSHMAENISPVKLANMWLGSVFTEYREILCIPNDVVLPRNLYREMLKYPRGVVTASMTSDPNPPAFERATAISENMPMCVVMWRKWVYDAIVAKDGYFFDERLWHYTSDCDLALRLSACGIRGVQLDLQYFHVGSASHRLAPQEEGDRMRRQADVDREAFIAKWGWPVTAHNYGQAAMDLNFKGESDGR